LTLADAHIALIPGSPLAAALWLGAAILFGQADGEAHERRSSRIVLGALGASFAAALVLAVAHLIDALPGAHLIDALPDRLRLGRWLASGDYAIDLVFSTDALSLTLAVLASLLCLLVARFAVHYMHREAGFHRLFMVLSLFAAAMALLVMGGNAVLTFIGWEIAGLCSYLLIAFFQVSVDCFLSGSADGSG